MCMVETQGLCLKVLLVLQRKWSGGEPTSVSPGLEASASEPLSLVASASEPLSLEACKLALSVLTSSMISLVLSKTNKTIYMLELTS